jgi:hypothetical protein
MARRRIPDFTKSGILLAAKVLDAVDLALRQADLPSLGKICVNFSKARKNRRVPFPSLGKRLGQPRPPVASSRLLGAQRRRSTAEIVGQEII